MDERIAPTSLNRSDASKVAAVRIRPRSVGGRLDRSRRAVPALLGGLTLAFVGVLLLCDASPRLFPAGAHDVLGALPLALIAVAYLLFQVVRRPTRVDLVKAAILVLAFFFWAANQLWSDLSVAILFNDIAIALFVLDVFLVIVGWPSTADDESFAETHTRTSPTQDVEEPRVDMA